jgi:hypothetical protein
MCDWLRERWTMRGLKRVVIIEKDKRPEGTINVTKFFVDSFAVPCAYNDLINPHPFLNWVSTTIKSCSEPKDFWKFPEETMKDGFGDCEDGAILLANLLYHSGFPYWKILVSVYKTSTGFHVVVVYDGEVLDWTNPTTKEIPQEWKLWYCFNARNAYTTKDRVEEWKQ